MKGLDPSCLAPNQEHRVLGTNFLRKQILVN